MEERTVGHYGGKFIPFHKGHLYSITKAASQVDHLYVVVSYDESRDRKLCKDAGLEYMDFKRRQQWMMTSTKGMSNVTVLAVEDPPWENEEHMWLEGGRRMIEAIPEKITHIFSSESSYDHWFRKIYGEDIQHVIIDEARRIFPISATKIRNEGVFANWDMIPEAAKPYYAKKIAVVGVESCGKSTLTRNLAQLFGTEYVEEYGRTVSEEIGDGSSLLTEEHYKEIVFGHKHMEFQKIKKANKLLFIDSEAVVSQYYAKMYLGQELDFIEGVIQSQDYDLYLFLEPDVKWVADGYRTFNDPEVREHTNKILKQMFDVRGIEYVSIGGNYEERLDKSIEQITKLMAN
ncbi:multifunctional transcriptional regulator/nicotinamide-nucleotide adenylyltransferase/ribosylnicotinamide kinase NadR [Sporosarcina gallistercoris]|uniref:Multifunctional transcriptional regulator/nicotinamide-nucleotide adenylyltransferase/ribosylnicotinamide kinase NadR n=1 Tax=Sporosarcina gallistercoris TaxID=2762245 RepID=A0ABR8PK26_9BACL|nr:multifunctional transcriptional regulator/nicotinamide-nucleotide adenylyltransferase/ribosylnicotinamide kinase NadR [Sporosarcina gallistercoris]MBD7908546.1 multifunctional transcriptional regulator/nicotinamide-nucleotide adenylyltransferase/ribosylnicotinamide kinase NadR [Sporosarcina gallistercoris]